MQPVDPKPNKREITYQIGWKKGRMEIGESGKVAIRTNLTGTNSSAWVRLLERTAWKPAFIISDFFMVAILWCVAPVAFVLTWLLVFFLGQ